MADDRRKIVEEESTMVGNTPTPTPLWVARPIPPPVDVGYNSPQPQVIISREELLEWLPVVAPATLTGTITDGPVNVRSGPGTKYQIIGSISHGKTFTCYKDVRVFADTHYWRQLVGQQSAYIAETFTSLAPSVPPPQPPPAPVKSPIGIHVADTGTIGDFRGVVSRAALTSHPVPSVTVVNDGGLCDFVRRTSPSTITVFRGGVDATGDRSPFGPDGSGNGYAWVNTMWSSYHSSASTSTFHQMYNEVSFAGNLEGVPTHLQEAYAINVARTEIDMMKRANEIGIRLTIGNYTAGVPDPLIFGKWLAPVWDFAQAYGHAALFHWYSMPGTRNMYEGREFMIDRFLNYFKSWPKLQIIIGEMGLYDAPRWTGPQIWTDAAAILRPYVRAGQKIVAMSWTIKGQNDIKWRDDDWTPHLNVYEGLLKSGSLA